MYVHTYIRIYIHTYIHTYIHAYIRIYIHTYINILIHKFIHTYIHTYMHTYIHTCIHIGASYGIFQDDASDRVHTALGGRHFFCQQLVADDPPAPWINVPMRNTFAFRSVPRIARCIGGFILRCPCAIHVLCALSRVCHVTRVT